MSYAFILVLSCMHDFFREEPLINTDTVDIDYLGSLPEGTFGKAYWHFLDKHVGCSLSLLKCFEIIVTVSWT